MAGGSFAILDDRGVVRVGGPDARPFLQNIITADMDRVTAGSAAYGGLLTPQGKVLFDFIIHPDGEGFLLDTPRVAATELAKRLIFYRLRARVEIANLSATHRVVAAWGGDAPPGGAPFVHDPRLPALGFRAVVAGMPETFVGCQRAEAGDYHAHRIGLGVPEGGVDFAYGETFPHDADMDQLGGVDFSKGCFIGQEVVSRMEHRGTARRRIVTAGADGPLPAAGAPITADGKPLGQLASVSGRHGLAAIRIDRARAALDAGSVIQAGDVPLSLAIPGWARFGWPSGPAED
jgi:folate-binding protein YgfZ